MDLGLTDRVVVVTGGAAGIGRDICRAFGQEGAHVVVADIVDGSGEDRPPAADELAALGVRSSYVRTDVSRLDQVEEMLESVVAEFGAVDVLVNNAAWWPLPHQFFWAEDPAHWQRMIDVVLYGALNCSRVVGDHMRLRGSGAIVNIASDSALLGEQKETTYSAAKGAVVSLTYSLAIGLGPSGVRVNCVSPGRTVSEAYFEERERVLQVGGDEAQRYLDRERRALRYYPLRKYGTPRDVSNVVLALASPVVSGHVTGQVVSVSGGFRVG